MRRNISIMSAEAGGSQLATMLLVMAAVFAMLGHVLTFAVGSHAMGPMAPSGWHDLQPPT
jgi:hypothetical protein